MWLIPLQQVTYTRWSITVCLSVCPDVYNLPCNHDTHYPINPITIILPHSKTSVTSVILRNARISHVSKYILERRGHCQSCLVNAIMFICVFDSHKYMHLLRIKFSLYWNICDPAPVNEALWGSELRFLIHNFRHILMQRSLLYDISINSYSFFK